VGRTDSHQIFEETMKTDSGIFGGTWMYLVTQRRRLWGCKTCLYFKWQWDR